MGNLEREVEETDVNQKIAYLFSQSKIKFGTSQGYRWLRFL